MDNNSLSEAAQGVEEAFAELEASTALALETYANVHRGTGYNSMASTLLYEQARNAVLNTCGLDKGRYKVVFCSPARAAALEASVRPGRSVVLSSRDLGFPLGLRAVIVRADSVPKGVPLQTGGGTAKIVSRRSADWEGAPDRFEAGTPPVISAITFARALELARRFGIPSFKSDPRQAASPRQILHEDDLLAFSGRGLLHRLIQTTMGRGRSVPTEEGSWPYVLLAEELAETAGLGVRTGCHCAHILVKGLLGIHPVREALSNFGLKLIPGIIKPLLPGLARVSFGLENGEADVHRLALALEKISSRRRSVIVRLLAKTKNAAPLLPRTKTRRLITEAIEREASSVFGSVQARPADKLPRPTTLPDPMPLEA